MASAQSHSHAQPASSGAPSGPQPPSPWAEKFGFPETSFPSLIRDGHSSLAPHLPYLDPRWYGTYPAGATQVIPKPLDENTCDQLFVSERLQQSHLAGMRTWQAATLNARLAAGVDGGHDADAAPPTMDMATALRVAAMRQAGRLQQPPQQQQQQQGMMGGGRRDDVAELLLQMRMLTVDEAAWCRAFARERWFDLDAKVKGRLPGAVGAIGEDDIWSVDNPVIWEQMRPCLELADRLLKASVQSGFLDTLIRGINIQFPTGDWHMYSNTTDDRASADAILQEVNRLAPRLVFSFVDEENSRMNLPDRHPAGETHRVHDEESKWFVYCGIHVRFLRVLLGAESTLAEKTLARFGFAVTVVHQLMHALFCCQQKQNEGAGPDVFPTMEWFIRNEWVQELGCSWENDAFGGQVSLHPSYVDRETGRGNFMFAAIQDWPNPAMGALGGTRVPGSELAPRKVFPVPTLWLSCLTTQEYWEQWITKYGLSALRFPKILRSARLDTRDHATRRLRVNYNVREMRPGLREAIAALTTRKRQWALLRPWHFQDYQKWSVSPWADVNYRAAVERFREASRVRDEVKAQMAYEEISLGCFLRGTETRNWYWEGVAWLMYLCLPERSTNLVSNQGGPPGPGRWGPSGAARAAGVTWEFEPVARNLGTTPYTLIERHGSGQNGSRRHSYAHVKKFLEEKEKLYPISMQLTQGFWRSWAYIGRKMRSSDLGEGDWIDFDFDFPPYQGYMLDIAVYGGPLLRTKYEAWQGSPSLQIGNYDMSSADSATERGDPFSDFDSDEGAPGVRPVPKIARLQVIDEPRSKKYYTIGEVGNHRSQGDLWLLCDDGMLGLDVHDATGIWEAMVKENPALLRVRMCEKTKYGWKITNGDLERHVKRADRQVGKLMQQWMKEEDVKEMDGLNGRPLWIVSGKRVFDATNFPCRTQLERSYLYFLQNPSKTKSPLRCKESFWNDLGDRAPEMHQELEQYICGTVRECQPKPIRERAFTVNEVGWHDNIDHRMYVIIQDGVYDITDYGHFHPGGTATLEAFAGRDATQQFKDGHQSWQECLEAFEYLKIGRVVAEREKASTELAEFEIVLKDIVYNIHPLTVTNKTVFESLRRWTGTDATTALGHERPSSLAWLEDQQNLIVAKFARPLREITPEMLAYNNDCYQPEDGEPGPVFVDPGISLAEFLTGSNKAGQSSQSSREVWVSVGEDVYCVSDLVVQGSSPDMPTGIPVWEALGSYAGQEITDDALGKWISDYHQCRKVGKLVQRPVALVRKLVLDSRSAADREPSNSQVRRHSEASSGRRRHRRKRKGTDGFDHDGGGDTRRAFKRRARAGQGVSAWI